MKHTKLSLIFMMIFLTIYTVISHKIATLTAITKLQLKYNNAMDNAISDALYESVDSDFVDVKTIDFASTTHSFFTYLALNLGLQPSSQRGRTIGIYIPVIAFVVEDGVYFAYQKEDTNSTNNSNDKLKEDCVEENEFYKGWNEGAWDTNIDISRRIPFVIRQGKYQIEYTLSDYVKITNSDTLVRIEGYYQDIKESTAGILPVSRKEFDQERRDVIINCITSNMRKYIAKHNKIAQKYGINYQFTLPRIEREDWYRTINDISMLALFQGFPYGNGNIGTYNRVALSGAMIRKNNVK